MYEKPCKCQERYEIINIYINNEIIVIVVLHNTNKKCNL